MTNVCILVSCGLPAAGKTTFAKEFALRARETELRWPVTDAQDFAACSLDLAAPSPDHPATTLAKPVSTRIIIPVHICYDKLMPKEIETELLNQDDYNTSGTSSAEPKSKWKDYRKRILSCVECLLGYLCTRDKDILAKLTSASESDDLMHLFKEVVWDGQNMELSVEKTATYIIMIDDNMYYQSMRYEYFQLARKYATGFGQIFFPASVQTSLMRNSQRGSERVPDDVIVAMAERLEEPDTRVSWQRATLTWQADKDLALQMSEVFELVHEVLAHPVQPLPLEDEQIKLDSRIACSRSVIHQADSILRKLVGEKTKEVKQSGEHTKDSLRKMATTFNAARTAILDDMRRRTLLLPQELEEHAENAASSVDSPFHRYICDLFNASLAQKNLL